MEYAPFGDLRYYITKGQRLNAPFPEEAIWRIFLQLCRCVGWDWAGRQQLLQHPRGGAGSCRRQQGAP